VLALLVVSHWPLDAVVHRPDLPLAPGESALIGLGLWNSMPSMPRSLSAHRLQAQAPSRGATWGNGW
jgi:hypothetical protein